MTTPPDQEPLDTTLESDREGAPRGVVTIGTAVGPYIVSRKLGAGAMGSVYAAWDARLEREVALKVLHLDSDDLLREARLLARLNHPNVVTVHEVTFWEGRIVLVMEHARGRSLSAWLAASPRTHAELLDVFTQCGLGLAAAHAAGVIHRDFKPDNALVDDTGRARVLDFGLATPEVNAAAGLAGSPAYMPLAQLEGQAADAKSDQFSWWVSLYEAFVGKRPHEGTNLGALLDERRREKSDLTVLPRWLRAPMERGLSKDPAARFPSMEDAARSIAPPRRRRIAIAAVLSLIVAVAVSAVVNRPPLPCSALAISPAALWARTDVPALREAITGYAGALERCVALPREQQTEQAQCLDLTGRELDLSLEVLESLPQLSAELRPRVLRRVQPARRCERTPLPRPAPWIAADRAALVDSLRAQLAFDAARAADQPEEAHRLATEQRVRADASKVVAARAWGRFNEAAALSASARIPEALALLREVEAFPGIGLREETWVTLSRWLFECYVGDEERCDLHRKLAHRFATELDEPWTRAFEQEIGMRNEGLPVEQVVAAWGAIPGAGLEVNRALSNELGGIQNEDDPLRIARARKLAASITKPDARMRMLILEFDALVALHEGDLARARDSLARLEAEPLQTPSAIQARRAMRITLLYSSGRYREVLALALAGDDASADPRFLYRMTLLRLPLLHELKEPGVAELEAQIALITPLLNESERMWLAAARERIALSEGDVKTLKGLGVAEGEEAMREWHLAVLTHDVARQRAVLAAASAPAADDWWGRRLEIEGLLEAGRFADAAQAAVRLRAEAPSLHLVGQVRLQEARARWALGQHAEACKVMTRHVLLSNLLPSEKARAEQFIRECPVVGISN